MLEKIKKVIHDFFTEPDGISYCPVRISSALCAIIYHTMAGIGCVVSTIHLDIATLGLYLQHMATLIGVASASVGAKAILKGDAPVDGKS